NKCMWIYVYVYIMCMRILGMKQIKKEVTRINSTIDSTLEKEFRELVNKKFEYKKGSIQFGLEEAIDQWIKDQKQKKGAKS
ncbi:MAG TPA: hypothetical protein VLD38_08025, partial [Nitrosopumilaceae archaeon]|nr:hypothetical protein [Nitrosopumilaceae archaeon]